jgi:hypothetical protein
VTRTSISGDAPSTCSVVELQKEHVGRGIDGAQRAIDLERLGGRLEIEPLRQHDLKDVARGNVFLRPPDAAHEIIVRGAVVDFDGLGFAAVRPVQMLPANPRASFRSMAAMSVSARS